MLKSKKLLITFIIALLVAAMPCMNAFASTLVWSDEFNGTSLSGSNWVYETGGGGWGNNELECYTNRTQNVSVSGGYLNITALKESYGGMNYTSGRIKTQGLHDWTYGTIDARIKIPTGQGLWPAFWMLGSNIGSVGWPQCGEMDIAEHVNTNTYNNGTMHWYNNGQADYGLTSGTLDFGQFHDYQIQWNTNAIKWYVDGTLYCTGNIQNNINGTDAFHKPFFILFNLAVGGNWPGAPNGSTVFPATMQVDYVRVYQ